MERKTEEKHSMYVTSKSSTDTKHVVSNKDFCQELPPTFNRLKESA